MHESISSRSTYEQIVRQTEFFSFSIAISLGEVKPMNSNQHYCPEKLTMSHPAQCKGVGLVQFGFLCLMVYQPLWVI